VDVSRNLERRLILADRGFSNRVAGEQPVEPEGLKGLIAAWGYEVTTAADGRAALEAVALVHPRAVITDLIMPFMTGLDLLTTLHEREPALPVILLTSHANLTTQVDAMQQGAYAYLWKPVDVPTLKMVLISALATSEADVRWPATTLTARSRRSN
jgi:DNA-binding NtrC family response regulator